MTKIVDIFDKYMRMEPQDRDAVQQYLSKVNTDGLTLRNMATASGDGGGVTDGNLAISSSDGITLYDPITGYRSIRLDPDGDAFFGSDIDTPSKTALAIFSNINTYNSNSYGAGDLLIGDDSSGKGNMWWDASAGTLNFRAGTTTSVVIGSGGIIATWGQIGGWTIGATKLTATGIILDSGNDQITVGASGVIIDGPNKLIKSADYSADTTGWKISSVEAEFANVRVRGTFSASVFNVEELSAVAGGLIVTKSASELYEDVTTPGSTGSEVILKVNDGDSDVALFANNDALRIKAWNGTAITDVWVEVDSQVPATGYTTYTCTLRGGVDTLLRKGMAVLDYGLITGGDGYVAIDSYTSNAPRIIIADTGTTPWSGTTTRGVIGNTRNTFGTGANDRYGFGFGDYSGGNYISYNAKVAGEFTLVSGAGSIQLNADGLKVWDGANNTIWLDADGDAFFGSNLAAPATTAFVVFANAQTYNSEAMGEGDVLFGDNSANKANVLWDKSAGQIKFRKQTTVHTYIDTDGAFYGGGGSVWINEDGLFVLGSGIGYESDKAITFQSVGGSEVYGVIFGYSGGGGANSFNIHAPDIASETNDLVLSAGDPGSVVFGSSDDVYTTSWRSFTPTVTGFSGTPTATCYYMRLGDLVFVTYDISGTSNLTTFTFTCPITAGGTSAYQSVIAYTVDNGVVQGNKGRSRMTSGSALTTLYYGTGAWTASGAKRAIGEFWYRA